MTDDDILHNALGVFIQQVGAVAVGPVVLVLDASNVADSADLVVVLRFGVEALGSILEQGAPVERQAGRAGQREPEFAERASFGFRLAKPCVLERPIVQVLLQVL